MRLEISDHAQSNIEGDGNYTIKNSKKMFILLSSKLYANPIRAIVREISTNAIDAHILSGTPERPFDVALPSKLRSTFMVRDYGPGLTDTQIREIYTTYGESTKDDSDDFNGAMGLGSKSPFGYTNTYTVASYLNGKKTTYTMFMLDGEPRFTAGEVEDAPGEENGLCVTVPVKTEDADRFNHEACSVFNSFATKPKINGQDFETWMHSQYRMTVTRRRMDMDNIAIETVQSDNFKLLGAPFIGVWMANVVYPINESLLEQSMANDKSIGEERAKFLCRTAFSHVKTVLGGVTTSVQFRVPTGSVGFTPNREDLQYDRKTVRYMSSLLAQVLDGLSKGIETILNELEESDPVECIAQLRQHPLWNAVSNGTQERHGSAEPQALTFHMITPVVGKIIGEDLYNRVMAVNYRAVEKWEEKYKFAASRKIPLSAFKLTDGRTHRPRICIPTAAPAELFHQRREATRRNYHATSREVVLNTKTLPAKLDVTTYAPTSADYQYLHNQAWSAFHTSVAYPVSKIIGVKAEDAAAEYRRALNDAQNSSQRGVKATNPKSMAALERARVAFITDSRGWILSTDGANVMIPAALTRHLVLGRRLTIIEAKTKPYSPTLRERLIKEAIDDSVNEYVLFVEGEAGAKIRTQIQEQIKSINRIGGLDDRIPTINILSADSLYQEIVNRRGARQVRGLDESTVRLYTHRARSDTTRMTYGEIKHEHWLPEFVHVIEDRAYAPLETQIKVAGKHMKVTPSAIESVMIALSRLNLFEFRKAATAEKTFTDKTIESCGYGRTRIGIIIVKPSELASLRKKGLTLPTYEEWINEKVKALNALPDKQAIIDSLAEYVYVNGRRYTSSMPVMERNASLSALIHCAAELDQSTVPEHIEANRLLQRAIVANARLSKMNLLSCPLSDELLAARNLLFLLGQTGDVWKQSVTRQLYYQYPLVCAMENDKSKGWIPGCKEHVLKYIQAVTTIAPAIKLPAPAAELKDPQEI